MIDVYEVSVEIEPESDAEFPADCVGAFVYCYVAAETLRESLDVATARLEHQHYRVVDMDHALRVPLDDYVPEDEDYPSRDDLERLLTSDDCEFGPFDCYQSRDDDAPGGAAAS